MKKLFLTTLAVVSIFLLNAQSTPKVDSLQEYTGKYKFPAGSVVTEINVVIDNGALFANSDAGNSELKKMQGDVFEVVSYSGTATFKRNPEGKIIGVKIELEDVTLEGTKSETPALAFSNSYSLKSF